MAKVLEKKVEKKVTKSVPVESVRTDAIESLTLLNGNLVERIKELSSELDSVKSKLDQVASRLGI